MNQDQDGASLLVCCEGLEHLEDPEKALEVLNQAAKKHVILSVPREPIWSFLNYVRDKYWFQLGNTPGHIHKWSTSSFVKMVSRHLEVLEVSTPLPWVMLLCKKK